MPNALIKSFAKQSGKTPDEIETYWKEAKISAKKAGFKDGTDQFYKYVVGIVKRRCGLTKKEEENLNQIIPQIIRGSNLYGSFKSLKEMLSNRLEELKHIKRIQVGRNSVANMDDRGR